MVYKVAPGAHIKTDPNIVGRMFEELEKTEQGLTAQTLLDANRPKNAPLHNEFEWDNRKAAEAYRLNQSSYIIRSIVVVPEEKPQEFVRAVFSVGDGKYENIRAILSDERKRESLLSIALRDLKSFERKYNTLSELAPIWAAMEQIERS